MTGVLTLVAAAVIAVVISAEGPGGGRQGGAPLASQTVEPYSPVPSLPSAEAIGVVIDHSDLRGRTTVHRDSAAARGPWTVSVHRRDGSLGKHGAVMTFPVGPPASGHRPVRINGITAYIGQSTVRWRVAGSYALIRGDLPRTELARIAANTTIRHRRPVVRAPAGLRVAKARPYRASVISGTRYGAHELPGARKLGGIVVAGIVNGGGFEDRLHAMYTQSGKVHGRPAIISTMLGGNGSIAWETKPGVVAYVSYSGELLNSDAIGILHQLANRTRILRGEDWQATRPSIESKVNDFRPAAR